MSTRPIEVGSPYHELIRPIARLEKLRLVLEILAAYPRVRWLLWRRDLPSVVAALRGDAQCTIDPRLQAVGARLGQAVGRTLAIVPFDSRCLVRSLVLTRMLATRRIGLDAGHRRDRRAQLFGSRLGRERWEGLAAAARRREPTRGGVREVEVGSLARAAALEIGNPAGLTPLDLATASMLGQEPRDPLPRAARKVSLDDVLFEVLEPALVSGRCFVSFSGGRESAWVLAAATAAARAGGHPDPIPATLRYPLAASGREVEHQERIVRALGLRDWQRVEILDELEIVGPVASRVLREVGVLFPVTTYMLLPLLELARGGWLLAGGGWTDFFAYWRWARLADAFARRRSPNARSLRQLTVAVLPPPARNALLRSREEVKLPGWLREEPARELEALLRAKAADVPVRFGAALERQRSHRCYFGVRASFDALAAAAGAQVLMPFRTDEYIGALAATGGRWGFGPRSDTFKRLAGHLLPEELLGRSDVADAQRVIFGDRTRTFANRWSGGGLDPEIVDPDVLQEIWGEPSFPWGATMLLQLAFQHDERRNDEGGKRYEVH